MTLLSPAAPAAVADLLALAPGAPITRLLSMIAREPVHVGIWTSVERELQAEELAALSDDCFRLTPGTRCVQRHGTAATRSGIPVAEVTSVTVMGLLPDKALRLLADGTPLGEAVAACGGHRQNLSIRPQGDGIRVSGCLHMPPRLVALTQEHLTGHLLRLAEAGGWTPAEPA